MHPTPYKFIIEHLAVIAPTFALVVLGLKALFTPPPMGDPVACPFCKRSGLRKAVDPETKLEGEVPCAYCHGVGLLASYETRYQTVKGPCRACHGKATLIELDGLAYPDGTLLPKTTAKQVPCTAKDCKDGWQTPHRKAVFGNLVPLSSAQLAKVLADARAIMAAEKARNGDAKGGKALGT